MVCLGEETISLCFIFFKQRKTNFFFCLLLVSVAAQAFSGCGEQEATVELGCVGFSLQWLLLADLRLSGAQASAVVMHGLKLTHNMWNLSRPGVEPVSPALAGRFFITGPPGKYPSCLLKIYIYLLIGLHQVLLAAHGIFELHRGMQDP